MPRIAHTDPHQGWTDRAKQVAQAAWHEACARGHDHIGPEHYLLALLRETDQPNALIGTARLVLESLDIPVDQLRERIDTALGSTGRPHQKGIPTTAQLQRALTQARSEAAGAGHEDVGTEHLLLGLAVERTSVAALTLVEYGATPERIRDEIALVLTRYAYGCPLPADEPAPEPVTVPADIRHYDQTIAQLRRDKETAVDAMDFQAAGQIRTEEKKVLAQRTEAVKQWSSGIDIVEVVTEVEMLRAQNKRLRSVLAEHGIEVPDEPRPSGSPTEASN